MIYSLSGKLIELDPAFAVVETAGVGYKCTTSTTTLASLPRQGGQVTLYTHLHVREDNLELFGFLTQEEVRCFRMLISVSGVGPKVAVAILSTLAPQRLMLAIAAGDAKAIRAPGVGPKLSQRIILELRDKVQSQDLTGSFSPAALAAGMGADPGLGQAPSAQGEAVAALVVLGYGQTDAAAAVSRLDAALPTDQLIKGALKILSRGV